MKSKKYQFEELEKVNSITELVERSARLYPENIAFRYKKKKLSFQKTYSELLGDSKRFASYLLSLNLRKGHVALLGASGYEWITAYIGVQFAGLTVVPLDKDLECDKLIAQIKKSDTDFLFFDNAYSKTAQEIVSAFSGELDSFMMEDPLPEAEGEVFFPTSDPDRLSAILFTSGTTGSSKGVMLTERNIAYNVTCGLGAINFAVGEDVALSILPLNHAFENTFTVFGGIYSGATVCISRSLKYLQKEIKEYQPTVMLVVPLIAEKLFEKVESTVKKQGKEKKFQKALKLSAFLQRFGIDISDKLFGEVKEAFGGKLRTLICGGAPLKEELIEKYHALGINLLQGYGLTECSPLLSVNFYNYHRKNSVGKVVDTCEVKIVDGEIWAKGSTISNGYYNDEENTQASFSDGWFRTGDLGYIDEDGFLFLTGRKKNLIILSNGENVSAEELEDLLYTLPYVEEVIVYGQDDKITAEIYPKEDIQTPEVNDIYKDIGEINKNLAYYKHIGAVVIRETPFPKTTTKKIIRKRENVT